MRVTTKKGTYPCLGCANCSSIIKRESIHHPTQGYNIPVRGYHTCKRDCVIYLLKCPCGKAYVGQTSHPIKVRLNEHKSNIRLFKSRITGPRSDSSDKKQKYGEMGVAKHFLKSSHEVSDLRWQIVEQLYGEDKQNFNPKLQTRNTIP